METLTTIPAAVAALIPAAQLKVTKSSLREYSEAIQRLEETLKKCPNIGATDNMKEHPAIFHYFYGSTDIFICEYDKKDLMFGYAILGGDLANSEWGYFRRSELTAIQQYNIDYHFEEQSIEAALYSLYPKHFKKPPSYQEDKNVGKNDKLPETYRDFPYQYTRTKYGTELRKNNEEVFLQGDDETKFFQDCNRAKQHGRSISDVISDYFY
jgi:hypothetical protein